MPKNNKRKLNVSIPFEEFLEIFYQYYSLNDIDWFYKNLLEGKCSFICLN